MPNRVLKLRRHASIQNPNFTHLNLQNRKKIAAIILDDLGPPHHSSPAKVRRNEKIKKIYASKNVSEKRRKSSRN